MFEIAGSELGQFGRKYKGVIIQQSKYIPEVFVEFLNRSKPQRILEIGSSFGGLASLLRDILDYLKIDCQIKSFDVRDKGQNKAGVEFIIENIFDKNYNLVNEEVHKFIGDLGTTVIICDGGKKAKEFNELSNYLKYGDFIMAHDYAENVEFFISEMKNKRWNGLEITERGIAECSEKYNLQHFMKKEMSEVAWVCKQKCPKS